MSVQHVEQLQGQTAQSQEMLQACKLRWMLSLADTVMQQGL